MDQRLVVHPAHGEGVIGKRRGDGDSPEYLRRRSRRLGRDAERAGAREHRRAEHVHVSHAEIQRGEGEHLARVKHGDAAKERKHPGLIRGDGERHGPSPRPRRPDAESAAHLAAEGG